MARARSVSRGSGDVRKGVLGVNDAAHARAYDELLKKFAPEEITPFRLQSAAGTSNFNSAKNWLLKTGRYFPPKKKPAIAAPSDATEPTAVSENHA
jgi:hypothetical protein